MSIKISELPQAANVGNNDFVPIVQNGETKKALASNFGGGGGTNDYTDLTNKPSINSVTLTGNKTSGDLNLVGTGDIATTIDSTSTNSQVAGAKAVYDATLDNYSTTEQVVGTWTDGKPLYQQTIIATYTLTSESLSQRYDLSSLNIDTFCELKFLIKKVFSSTNYDCEPAFYSSTTDLGRVFYRKTETQSQLEFRNKRNKRICNVYLHYTLH